MKTLKKINKNDERIELAKVLIADGAWVGIGATISDIVYAVMPQDAKIAGKAIRVFGGLVLAEIINGPIEKLTNDFIDKTIDSINESVDSINDRIEKRSKKKVEKKNEDKTEEKPNNSGYETVIKEIYNDLKKCRYEELDENFIKVWNETYSNYQIINEAVK